MSESHDHHNQKGLVAFLGSIIGVLLFFIYIVGIHPGIDLNENLQNPNAPKVESAEAAAAVDAVDVATIADPWVANAALVEHGKKVFAQNCAMCHGEGGAGDGAAGAALNPKPRNLIEGPWKLGGGYQGLYAAISQGIPGSSMSAYGHMKSVDRWALVQFIDSITKAKVSEDPAKLAEFAKSAK